MGPSFNGVQDDVSAKRSTWESAGFSFFPLSKCIVRWTSQPQADFQNQLRYDQEKAALDEWLLSMAFHNRRHRVKSKFQIECL